MEGGLDLDLLAAADALTQGLPELCNTGSLQRRAAGEGLQLPATLLVAWPVRGPSAVVYR